MGSLNFSPSSGFNLETLVEINDIDVVNKIAFFIKELFNSYHYKTTNQEIIQKTLKIR